MERPRESTSGGQSGGRVVGMVVVVVVDVDVEEEEGEGEGEVSFFVMASQEATEVQERQLLGGFVSFSGKRKRDIACLYMGEGKRCESR